MDTGLPQRLTIEIQDIVDRLEVGIPTDRMRLDQEEAELRAVLAFARSGRASATPSVIGEVVAFRGSKSLAKAKAEAKIPKVTHRVLVLLALAARPEGASVAYIVAWAAAVNVLEDEVARTSISPLLKKMSDAKKGKDEVRHDREAHRWMITDDGKAVAEAFRQQWLEAGQRPFWDVTVEDRKDGE